MKLQIFLSRRFLPGAILIIIYLQSGFSQVADSRDSKQQGFFFGAGLEPSFSQIKNLGVQFGSDLTLTKKNGFSGSLEIGYYFSKYFGISSGLNYSSYNSQTGIGSYQNRLAAIDQDNENYDLRVSGTAINEIQKIGILGIPICLNFRIPFKSDMGFFVKTGINTAIPLRNNYITSGTFTYKGYYSQYNLLLEKLPEYGFSTNLATETTGDLTIKPIINCAIVSVGFDYLVHSRVQISLEVMFNKSLGAISKYTPTENFQLSTGQNQLNSIMQGSSNVIIQSFGLNIGLRYFITDFSKNKYYSKRKLNKYLEEDQRGKKIYIEQ